MTEPAVGFPFIVGVTNRKIERSDWRIKNARKSIADYSADEICIFADIINALPRKQLGYKTPEELYDAELDKIYAAPAQISVAAAVIASA